MAHTEEDFSESSLWMPGLVIASLLVPLRKISEGQDWKKKTISYNRSIKHRKEKGGQWNRATDDRLPDVLVAICGRHENGGTTLHVVHKWQSVRACLWKSGLQSLSDKLLVRFRGWCGTMLYKERLTACPSIKVEWSEMWCMCLKETLLEFTESVFPHIRLSRLSGFQ